MKKILVSALEPSANLHLKELLLAYKELYGSFELYGIYDEAFCEDFDINPPTFSSHEFSAMGFVEVLPLILKAKRAINTLANIKADIFIAIDSPAFNMPLAKRLCKSQPSLKKLYYILPQVWAWKKKRAKKVRELFDVLASIWPFEDRWYKEPIYVGAPLLDELGPFLAKRSKSLEGLDTKNPLKAKKIAFLPGSRRAEIARLMPIFKELAKSLDAKKILCVPSFNTDKISELYGDISDFELCTNTPFVLSSCDFAFICSGTATLEAALLQCPFVLVYKAARVDYLIAKSFLKLEFIGLGNIIAHFRGQKPLHPELIQEKVNVQNLLFAYENYDYEGFFSGSFSLREYLGCGSAKKLAKIINEILKKEDHAKLTNE